MTYAELQTEVQTILIDTPPAIIALTGKFINRAIRKLQTKHNFKAMEAVLEAPTTLFTRELVARPSDWKEARNKPFYTEFGQVYEMRIGDIDMEAQSRFGTDAELDFGPPRLLIENEATGALEVYPFPDGAADSATGEYTITIPYWKYLPELAGDASTNWFTTNAEEYIIYRAAGFGFYTNEDEDRGDKWFRLASGEFADVVRADKQRRLANTDTLVPHLGARSPHTME